MNRMDLGNGIPILYGSDPRGKVVFQYPDGSRVQTTWTRLSRINALVESLRDLYEHLLLTASGDGSRSDAPIQKLMWVDDLLFEMRR